MASNPTVTQPHAAGTRVSDLPSAGGELSQGLAASLGEWDMQRSTNLAQAMLPGTTSARSPAATASTPDWDRVEREMWDVIDGEALDAPVSERTLASAVSSELRALSTEYSAHAAARAALLDARAVAQETALFSALFDDELEAVAASAPAVAFAEPQPVAASQDRAKTPLAAEKSVSSHVISLAARRRTTTGWRTSIAIGFAAAAAVGLLYTARIKENAFTPKLGAVALQPVADNGGVQSNPAWQNSGRTSRTTLAASTLVYVEANGGLVRTSDTAANESPLAMQSDLHEDESFVLSNAHAAFEQRSATGDLKVAWAADALGGPSHAVVPVNAKIVHASSPLVVALESGAIEAEVTPIAVGEAFAIDVGASRVAVHGTHLRVARSGSRISVDLIHGEIAIGRIPANFARTSGRTILAPAHVEFDAESPEVLTLGSAPVREILTFGTRTSPSGWATGDWTTGYSAGGYSGGALGIGRADGSKAALEKFGGLSAKAAGANDSAKNPNGTPQTLEQGGAATHSKAAAAITSRAQLMDAVRVCIERQAIHASDAVKVTVVSNLELRLREDGTVQGARFSPPLQPAAQECATAAIYASKLDDEPRQLQLDIQVQK